MTKKQTDEILARLREGATLREAAAIAEVDWDDFVQVYNERGEAYKQIEKARALCRATLRQMAAEESGSKSASDRLALLRALEAEPPVEELAPPDPYENLWARNLPPALAAAVRDVIGKVPVDADALVDGAGQWTREGADAAAADHEGRS